MAKKRNRTRPAATFEERLAGQAQHFKELANNLPEGKAREVLLRRAWQLETASKINEWLRSPVTADRPASRADHLTMSREKAFSIFALVVGASLPIALVIVVIIQ